MADLLDTVLSFLLRVVFDVPRNVSVRQRIIPSLFVRYSGVKYEPCYPRNLKQIFFNCGSFIMQANLMQCQEPMCPAETARNAW